MLFNLDTPNNQVIEGFTRFSGWYIPDTKNDDYDDIRLLVNGISYCKVDFGLKREDVYQIHSKLINSLSSGWAADFVVNKHIEGKTVEISIIDFTRDIILHKKCYLCHSSHVTSKKKKLVNLRLMCPFCRNEIKNSFCDKCNIGFDSIVDGVCFFLPKEQSPIIRLSETNPTHPYSNRVLEIINQHKKGIVLDFGCGNIDDNLVFDNVIGLDVACYKNTDMIVSTDVLPFFDNTFDAIVSQATFEHIRKPWLVADELYRILKPTGHLYVETAFMQPYHGDPSHYFNMTKNGFKEIFEKFKIQKLGIAPHQHMSWSLEMQIQSILPFLTNQMIKNEFKGFLEFVVQNRELMDNSLDSYSSSILAAGFYLEATK